MTNEEQAPLVRSAKQGDQEAIERLYHLTQGMVFFTAMRYVHNEADAADVTQNAYMAAFSKLDTFDERQSFSPWLRRITVNQALNFLRGRKELLLDEELIDEIMDDEDLIPSHYLEQKEKREEILRIVAALPEGQRLAITLFYFEGSSIAEIAETMGIKPGTAKSHLHWGRKAIKEAVLEEERKGNKLYTLLPVPVLTSIFTMEAQAAEMPPALAEKVLQGLIASLNAAGAISSPSALSRLRDRFAAATVPAKAAAAAAAALVIVAAVTLPGLLRSAGEVPQAPLQEAPVEPSAVQLPEEISEPEPEPEPPVPTQWENDWLADTLRAQLNLGEAAILSSDLEHITQLAILGTDTVILNGDREFSYEYEKIEWEVQTGNTKVTYTRNGPIKGYTFDEDEDGAEYSELGVFSSFADLRNFPNLEKLTFSFNDLSGQPLEQLADLPALKSLDLTNTGVTDLSFLQELRHLEGLSLSNCPAEDLSAISSMTGLTQLALSGMGLTDIAMVEPLVNMEDLNLDINAVADLSPIAGMRGMRELSLDVNQVSDLSPLSDMPELERLAIKQNQVTDLSPLAGCAKLEYLKADQNSISDLSPLSGTTRLTDVWLQTNSVADLSPLAGNTEMRLLAVSTNRVSDLSPLTGMSKLEEFYAGENEISDLSPLAGLSELSRVYVFNNRLSDLSPLSGLTQMEWLNIGGNSISDLSPLSGLTKMEWLRIYANNISDLSVVANMPNLEHLMAGNNPIYDYSPAAHVEDVQ